MSSRRKDRPLTSGSTPQLENFDLNDEQDQIAVRVAQNSHAAKIVADFRGVSVEDITNNSVRRGVRSGEGSFIEVLFPEISSSGGFSAGGINIVPSRQSISIDRAVTYSADANVDNRTGTLTSYTEGKSATFTGAELADQLATVQSKTMGVEPMAAPSQQPTSVTGCLQAAGIVVSTTALIIAAAGCGSVCSALILGGVTAPSAPYVCAACIGLAIGAPTGTIIGCLI